MKKLAIASISLLLSVQLSAQKNINFTEQFTIEGLVEREAVITFDSLMAYPSEYIDSVVITNHLGERKSVLHDLKVVPLLHFLKNIQIKVESPKQLSEFYFVFEAGDGYKVVFSWNELFNSTKGQEFYAIVGQDETNLGDLPDRIAVITPTDFMTGRRYVKSLSKIRVMRAN